MRTLEPFRRRIGGIVCEAGPTGYTLARVLRQHGFNVDVIAPSRTPKTTGKQVKSDRLDSRKLAMWSAKGLLQPVQIPTEVAGRLPGKRKTPTTAPERQEITPKP